MSSLESVLNQIETAKTQWAEQFIAQFTCCIKDREQMALAFNSRAAIRHNDELMCQFTADTLNAALTAIAAGSHDYTIDEYQELRLDKELLKVGLSQKILDSMVFTDKLRYSAAIFYTLRINSIEPDFSEYLHRTDPDHASLLIQKKSIIKAELIASTKPIILKEQQQLHYDVARLRLIKTLGKQPPNSDFTRISRQILRDTDALSQSGQCALPLLTDTLTLVDTTLNVQTLGNAQACAARGLEFSKIPKANKIGGLLLKLAGAVIILASIAVALYSFGALSPLSVLGVSLGASLLAGGIAVGAGTLGAANVACGFWLSKPDPLKAKLANSLDEFSKLPMAWA